MKKKATIAAALCLAASMTGCGNLSASSSEVQAPSWLGADNDGNDAPAGDFPAEDNGDNEREEEAPAVKERSPAPSIPSGEESAEAESDEAERPEPDSASFRYGVWWANDGSGDRYYCFAKANRLGAAYSQADGSGVDFDYDIYGNTAIFHMDNSDSTEKAMVRWIDDGRFVLQWEDGRTETAAFYSAIDYDDFFHYTNSDLAALALDHFETFNHYRPTYAETDIGEGGLVIVELYDGEELVESYALDRFTASGTNSSGGPVVLD